MDFGDGLVWRDPVRGIIPGDGHGMLPGMRVGAVLDPAVDLALTDSAGFLQDRDCPAP